MTIKAMDFWRYRIPFRGAFNTATETRQVREGVIIRLTSADGLIGLGDAAPLDSFSTGDIDSALDLLAELKPQIAGQPVSTLTNFIRSGQLCIASAPVRFALDSARLDIEAQLSGVSLSNLLFDQPAATVPVNATIGAARTDEAVRQAREAAAQGYSALKLKVNLLENLDHEVARIAAVRDAIGARVALRLDANASMTFPEAVAFCERVSQLDIDYLEQPLPARDIEGTARLRRVGKVPIAADESAGSLHEIENLIALSAADVIIIKPGVIGSVDESVRAIRTAQRAGLRAVVTSSLDSGIGVTVALHIAAGIQPPVSPCGLATLELLEDDLILDGWTVEGGAVSVPDTPGIGVEFDASSPCLTRILC